MSDQPLQSFVFVMRALQPCSITAHMGRAVRQCIFGLIHQVNNQVVTRLHEGKNDIRPYTVSDLMINDKSQSARGIVKEGDSLWFRVSALNNEVVALIPHLVERYPGREIELNGKTWLLEAILTEKHLWTDQTTYHTLGAKYMQARPARDITLAFATPTGFHSKGNTMPLPLPTLVFESLAMRWNAFTSAPLPVLLHPFVEQNLSIVAYKGATRRVILKENNPEVGFIGEVTYRVARRNATLEKVDPILSAALQEQFTILAQSVNLLADFAFYSGVGIKTTVGMGMVRRLSV